MNNHWNQESFNLANALDNYDDVQILKKNILDEYLIINGFVK